MGFLQVGITGGRLTRYEWGAATKFSAFALILTAALKFASTAPREGGACNGMF